MHSPALDSSLFRQKRPSATALNGRFCVDWLPNQSKIAAVVQQGDSAEFGLILAFCRRFAWKFFNCDVILRVSISQEQRQSKRCLGAERVVYS
jgi:hypothetical protein